MKNNKNLWLVISIIASSVVVALGKTKGYELNPIQRFELQILFFVFLRLWVED